MPRCIPFMGSEHILFNPPRTALNFQSISCNFYFLFLSSLSLIHSGFTPKHFRPHSILTLSLWVSVSTILKLSQNPLTSSLYSSKWPYQSHLTPPSSFPLSPTLPTSLSRLVPSDRPIIFFSLLFVLFVVLANARKLPFLWFLCRFESSSLFSISELALNHQGKCGLKISLVAGLKHLPFWICPHAEPPLDVVAYIVRSLKL